MSIAIAFSGDHPITVAGVTLDGFRRPLGGESASLTVTVSHAALAAEWLDEPPLGIGVEVRLDGAPIMSGTLFGVSVTSARVALRIEG